MGFVSCEISLIALIPALLLCGYIYYKDKVEKEPIRLLLFLFLLGAISYVPTLMLEKVVSGGVDGIFSDAISFLPDGTADYRSEGELVLHKVLVAFLGEALIENCIKLAILFFSTRNNRNFNYMFDGVVYSVFVSLGFAAAESLQFAWINGWDMLLLRLLVSTPGHLIAGIMMGYYYAVWNAYRRAEQIEAYGTERGLVREKQLKFPVGRMLASVLLPTLLTGIYVLTGSIQFKGMNILFYFVVFLLYGLGFVGVESISAEDRSLIDFSRKILGEKHPEVGFPEWEKIDVQEKGKGAKK